MLTRLLGQRSSTSTSALTPSKRRTTHLTFSTPIRVASLSKLMQHGTSKPSIEYRFSSANEEKEEEDRRIASHRIVCASYRLRKRRSYRCNNEFCCIVESACRISHRGRKQIEVKPAYRLG